MRFSDEEIVARLRKGERRLYASLVDRYKDRGYSLALRILRNREDAEEALQDAFVRAWNGLAGFEGASSFGTWFYRILYNVCMTAVEKKKRESIFDEPGEEGLPDAAADPGMTGDYAGVEMRDLVARVGGAISRLPVRYASVISMFYVQELSYPEIAEVTGLPVGTVKTHLFRGRLLLQEEVRKELTNERIAV
jgi:RNA polymerase sigma-70 factor (ECF subfamily)